MDRSPFSHPHTLFLGHLPDSRPRHWLGRISFALQWLGQPLVEEMIVVGAMVVAEIVAFGPWDVQLLQLRK